MLKDIKKLNFLLFITLFLVACGGGGGGGDKTTATKPVPAKPKPAPKPTPAKPAGPPRTGATQPQHLSSGVNKISQTGKGQKIGISELEGFRNNLNEFKDRLETGLTQNSDGTISSYKGTSGGKPSHSTMVTAIAAGKKYGIAPGAKIIPYNVKSKNLEKIYDHAKKNKLVAVNGSWGFRRLTKEDLRVLTDLNDAEKLNVLLAKTSIFKTGEKRVYIDTRKNFCAGYKQAISDIDNGETLQVMRPMTPPTRHNISKKELTALYELHCKGAASKYLTRAYHDNSIGKTFIDKIIADADNNRDGTIWVWAAGNDSQENGSLPASLPLKIPKLKPYWLSVVNIKKDGQINYDSATCGLSKDFCLGAIGNTGKSINPDGSERQSGGTSSAAPAVTGGLAVIKQRFPLQDNRWVRKRMLSTAKHETADGKKLKNKKGTVVNPDSDGKSDVFGHGIMRLDLATQPVGATATAFGGDTINQATKTHIRKSAMYSSKAFGDGLSYGIGNVNTYIFDSQNAPFKVKYNQFIGGWDSTNYDLNMLSNHTYEINNKTKQSVSYVNDILRKSEFITSNNSTLPYSKKSDIVFNMNNKIRYSTNRVSSHTIQFDKNKNKNFTYAFGYMYEKGSILGAKLNGVFKNNGSANTMYTNLNYINTFNTLTFKSNLTIGFTEVNGTANVINNFSTLTSSAYGASLIKNINENKIGISYNQTLRIEKGLVDVNHISKLAKGKNNNTKISYSSKRVDITPTGRERIIEVFYQPKQTYNNVRNQIRLFHTIDKNHISGNNDTTIYFFKKIKF